MVESAQRHLQVGDVGMLNADSTFGNLTAKLCLTWPHVPVLAVAVVVRS